MPGPIRGDTVDEATRCSHHATPRDIVAFRFRCCGDWYPCRACHDENVDHATDVWRPGEFDERAVLCGACHETMTIEAYLACKHRCPSCAAAFNPGCRAHWHLYFDRG